MRTTTVVLAALLLVGVTPRASAVPCDHIDYVVDCGYTVSVPLPSVTQVMDDYTNFASQYYAGEYVLSFDTPVGLTELMLVHSSVDSTTYGIFMMGPNSCDDTSVGWATYAGYAPVPLTGLGQQLTYYLSIDSTLPIGIDEWVHVTFVCNQAAVEFCGNDGVDNDYDGLFDCDDPDCVYYQGCQPYENCLNGIDDNNNGLIDCADPLCASSIFCIPQEDCTDGYDNNGDGLADCLAPPLGPDPYCTINSLCPPEQNCYNLIDDDYDGYIDCQDTDCPNYPCTEICDNGIDDNFDGWIDCDDVLCLCDLLCWGGKICDDFIDNDGDGAIDCNDCECFLQGPCLGEVCDNGFDDDGDGFIDCDDAECVNAPNCVANEIGFCNDYLDNDADGFVDCADPDCFNDPYCTGLCDVINDLTCGAVQQWASTLAQDTDIIYDYSACGGVDDWLNPETSWGLPGESNDYDTVHVTVTMPGQGTVDGLVILEELGGDDCDRYSPCLTTVGVGQTAVFVPQPGAEYYAVVESNGIQAQYEIEVQCISTVEDCADTWTDNDNDGDLPCDDSDCIDYLFPDEDVDGVDICDDCYDLDDTVYPGAPEVPCDTIDQDCDGTDIGEIDDDGDGYFDEDCPEGEDCDDTDESINPGADEDCHDGIDNDCDGDIDGADDECEEPADDDTQDDDDAQDDDGSDDDDGDDDIGEDCEGCCCEDCSVQQTRTETGISVALLLAMTGLLARRRSQLGRSE